VRGQVGSLKIILFIKPLLRLSVKHFPAAACLFLVNGILAHITRAVFHLFPDRLSDSHILDIAISDGYSFWDWYYGTEYDDYGYYELYSTKNLRLSVIYNMVSFVFAWFCIPQFNNMLAYGLNWVSSSFGQAVLSSIEHYITQ